MAFVSIIFVALFMFVLLLSYNLFFKSSSKLLIIAIVFIIFFLGILGLTLNIGLIELNNTEDFSKLIPYGDYIGGIINPIISVFAVFAAGFAFYAQYDANRQVQRQFEEQKKGDYVQNFESNFYNLLSIHHQIVSDIDLKTNKIFHFNEELEIFIKKNKLVDDTFTQNLIINSELNSRDAFVYIFDLLDYFLWIDMVIYYWDDRNYVEKNIEDVNDFHSIFKNKYEIKCYDHNLTSKFPEIYNTIYSAVSSDLGHYFRNLYRIIKYIDKANFSSNSIEDYKIKYEYTSILRAQISDPELKILFLNCIYYHGNEKFKPLLEKYTFFKIIDRSDEENNFFKNYSLLYKDEAFITPKEQKDIENLLDKKNYEKVVINKIIETSVVVEQV